MTGSGTAAARIEADPAGSAVGDGPQPVPTAAGEAFPQDRDRSARSDQELQDHDLEALLRLSFDHAPVGQALIGIDGLCARANHAMCRITGYSAAELRALNVLELIHPDDFAAQATVRGRLLAGEVDSYTSQVRLRTATGQTVWVSNAVSLIRSGDGAPRHFLAQVADVTERRRGEEILEVERRRLRAAQAIGRVGWWEMDVGTGKVVLSDTLLGLYGLDPARSELDYGGDVLRLIHAGDSEKVDGAIQACIGRGDPFRVRHRAHRAGDGGLRWLDTYGEAVYDGERLVRLAGSAMDVTEQVLAEADLRAAHALQDAVISASSDVIFVYDVSTKATVWANRSLDHELGHGGEDLGGPGPGDFLHTRIAGDGPAQIATALANFDADPEVGKVVPLHYRMRHADGTDRWYSLRAAPLRRDGTGRVAELVGVLRDVTDAMIAAERLERAALYDDLTGLPNRRLVNDRLAQALDRPERGGEVVVLFCDLDGFKRVNDSHGHHAGDAVLAATAARMQAAARSGDTVGRMGGDEFIVVCAVPQGAEAAAFAHRIVARIEAVVAEPITFDGGPHRVTISIGIRVAGQGDDADTVLRDSDAAMYLAKSRGKDGHAMWEPDLFAERLDQDLTPRQIQRSRPAHPDNRGGA